MEKGGGNFYHGTDCEIHTSERPFLDPRLARGGDEGDPETGHVFATPDQLIASMFAFKGLHARTILKTSEGPAIVFYGSAPQADAEGYVYEVPAAGFRETMRRGQPSGKWAMVESDMPTVRDSTGEEVPGIPIGEPVRKVSIRTLIKKDGLRVYMLTEDTDYAVYEARRRDASSKGPEAEAAFIHEAMRLQEIHDITEQLRSEP